ncbi:hypothetical protein REMIM1_PE00073 (plasmid) [Rhizobium etli bv. mimosae str. Mim1]|nr:hypothetical protein REMIM1_PE00073 [Rhizobium etli bv. mimosae str. Mim1]
MFDPSYIRQSPILRGRRCTAACSATTSAACRMSTATAGAWLAFCGGGDLSRVLALGRTRTTGVVDRVFIPRRARAN